MEPSTGQTHDSVARSGLFRMLSLGFSLPQTATMAEFQRLLGHLREGQLAYPGLPRPFLSIPEAPADSLAEAWRQLFGEPADLGGDWTPCPHMADDGAGLAWHLPEALDRISRLALREIGPGHAPTPESRAEAQATGLFCLETNLGEAAITWCDAVIQRTSEPFYRHLAEAVRALLVADLARAGDDRFFGPACFRVEPGSVGCPALKPEG